MSRFTLWLAVLLVLVGLRLLRGRRRGDRVCPRCGRTNPAHRDYCRACSARLARR